MFLRTREGGTGMLMIVGRIFDFSWWLWPFVFVFSLAWGIREWVHDECCSPAPLFVAGLSLMILVGGLLSFA